MEQPVINATLTETLIFYSSTLGFVLTVVISFILICHLSHYLIIHLRVKSAAVQSKQVQSKTVYLIVILHLLTACIAAVIVLLARMSLFTGIIPSKFQCNIGDYLSYLFAHLSYTVLYITFIYRIKKVLKGSTFDYKPCLIALCTPK